MLCCLLAGIVAAAVLCDDNCDCDCRRHHCHERCRDDAWRFDPEMNIYNCCGGCCRRVYPCDDRRRENDRRRCC